MGVHIIKWRPFFWYMYIWYGTNVFKKRVYSFFLFNCILKKPFYVHISKAALRCHLHIYSYDGQIHRMRLSGPKYNVSKGTVPFGAFSRHQLSELFLMEKKTITSPITMCTRFDIVSFIKCSSKCILMQYTVYVLKGAYDRI